MDLPSPAVRQGDLLRMPLPDESRECNLSRFRSWLGKVHGHRNLHEYPALWQWSADQPDAFWRAVAEFFEVKFHRPPDGGVALASREMPGAQWFPGATLNYAEHVFRHGNDTGHTAPAIVFQGDDRERRQEISRGELARRVRAVAAGLRARGVGRGDRVVGYLPNLPETVVAFLAAASVGAVWSNCPAELASRGVTERFAQIEPRVLFAVGSYRYGGKTHDRREALREIVAGLPTLERVILVPGPDGDAPGDFRAGVAAERWETLSGRIRRYGGRLSIRTGAVRSSAVDSLFVRHDRAFPRPSCKATAASCSNTSRRSRCNWTSARATGFSGTPARVG